MGKMEKELKELILDGLDSPEDEAEEMYPPMDIETCLENLVRITGKSKEELLEMINKSMDEKDPYED